MVGIFHLTDVTSPRCARRGPHVRRWRWNGRNAVVCGSQFLKRRNRVPLGTSKLQGQTCSDMDQHALRWMDESGSIWINLDESR